MIFKKILLILCCAVVLFAQDVIIRTNHETIEAIVTLIGEDVIEYKMKSNPDGPIRQISRRNVLMIMFEDGTREVFSTPTTTPAPTNENVQQETKSVRNVLTEGKPNLSLTTRTTFRRRYRQVNVFINNELVAENLPIGNHKISVPYGNHTIRATNEGYSTAQKILITEEGVINRIDINSSRIGLSLRELWISFVNVGYQQFSDFYPENNSYYLYNYDSRIVSPGSFYLEFGTIHRSSRFTYSMLFNCGPGNLGYGIFLGGTTSGSNIFKFRGGVDLGFWGINTQSLESGVDILGRQITYGRVRENMVFGGPHINFLVGHNPIFVSISLKTLFGIYDEYDMATYYNTSSIRHNIKKSLNSGFSAIPSWNIGLNFTF